MNNAEKFQEVFGLYATELWAKPENEFLEWLNAKFEEMKVTDTWKVAGSHELNAWCPNCEHRITRGCSYCPTCGVKLDWSGNEQLCNGE